MKEGAARLRPYGGEREGLLEGKAPVLAAIGPCFLRGVGNAGTLHRMKLRLLICGLLAGSVLGLMLTGCVDRPFPDEQTMPEQLKKDHESGKLNTTEYDEAMRGIKGPGWQDTSGNTTTGGNATTGGNTTDGQPTALPVPSYQYSAPSGTM